MGWKMGDLTPTPPTPTPPVSHRRRHAQSRARFHRHRTPQEHRHPAFSSITEATTTLTRAELVPRKHEWRTKQERVVQNSKSNEHHMPEIWKLGRVWAASFSINRRAECSQRIHRRDHHNDHCLQKENRSMTI